MEDINEWDYYPGIMDESNEQHCGAEKVYAPKKKSKKYFCIPKFIILH